MSVLKVNAGTSGSPEWVPIVALPQYFPRVTSTASTATLTVNVATTDLAALTAQAAGLTVAAPTGTAQDGQSLLIRIKDNGTARAISWNAAFRGIGVVLPTSTVVSKLMYVASKWNSADSKWDVLAVGQE